MPWSKVKTGSSWSVVNDETGDVKGSGMTEEEAERMVRALYANVHEDRKMGRRPKGKGGPADSLNPPYSYEGDE